VSGEDRQVGSDFQPRKTSASATIKKKSTHSLPVTLIQQLTLAKPDTNAELLRKQRAQVEEFQRRHRTGLLTLLFTDIVGSTQLKQTLGDSAGVALIETHHATIRQLLTSFPDAEVVDTAGDSFFVLFVRPSDAVVFALRLQARLRALGRLSSTPVLDRIGIHIGEVIMDRHTEAGPRLFGTQVDACARIMALAAPNQILLSRAAFDNARQALKGKPTAELAELNWVSHGNYSLKGLDEPVEICEVGERGLAPFAAPAGQRAEQHQPGRFLNRRIATILAVVAIALVAAWWSIQRRPVALPPKNSIAVLPFVSADPAEEFLGDGLTDDVTTALGQAKGLHVMGRTSAFTFKHKDDDWQKIASQLHVHWIVRGKLRKIAGQVRIDPELIDMTDGSVSWSNMFDSSENDISSLYRTIASGILVALKLPPLEANPAVKPPRPGEPEAQLLTWKGRFYWNKRGEANLNKAIEFFQQAQDADPAHAPAWSGLGDAYIQLGYGSFLAPSNSFPKARAAAMKAIELDQASAEPHATLGFYNLYYAWNWEEARKEFGTAIRLNPNYATAHEWYSYFLIAMGEAEQAQSEGQRARELDPLSVPIAGSMGFILHYSWKQAEAIVRLRDALKSDPTYLLGHLFLGRALQAQGHLDQALVEYHATGPLTNWVPTLAGMGYVYAQQGQTEKARQVLAQLEAMKAERYVTSYGVALVYCALGDANQTIRTLQQAVEERTHWLVWLNRDLRWEPIRADPRFQQIVRAVGLPK
jgi:TolB-like protein/class 3 adenylate cyclase/Tfp pilus assembly protein PilF